jgi:uncharacterized phosphosugar-binding protein
MFRDRLLDRSPACIKLKKVIRNNGSIKCMLATQWLANARSVMDAIESTQMENIKQAAAIMAESIAAERWVHTFGCGHATLPVEEMYPRIGGFVGFHPMIELPLTFFTNIVGGMGVHQFVFLERVEGYGKEIMKSYRFDPRDTMWLFSHSGINNVNIDIALEARKIGMKVVVLGSAEAFKDTKTRHSSGKKIFELADVVVDTCVPAVDASVDLINHQDKIAPVSTIAFVSAVWMIVATVAEYAGRTGRLPCIFIRRTMCRVILPPATGSMRRSEEYKRRIAGV